MYMSQCVTDTFRPLSSVSSILDCPAKNGRKMDRRRTLPSTRWKYKVYVCWILLSIKACTEYMQRPVIYLPPFMQSKQALQIIRMTGLYNMNKYKSYVPVLIKFFN